MAVDVNGESRLVRFEDQGEGAGAAYGKGETFQILAAKASEGLVSRVAGRL